MIKRYCDICGKEVTETTKYMLPEKESVPVKDRSGAQILSVMTLKPEEKDVCDECASWIFRAIKYYFPFSLAEMPFSIDTENGYVIKEKLKKHKD